MTHAAPVMTATAFEWMILLGFGIAVVVFEGIGWSCDGKVARELPRC